MPITSSAIKALRQDRSRAIRNDRQRQTLKRALKTVNVETLSATVSLIDKAVKNHLMHANRAARIKSQLAKRVGVATAKRPGAGASPAATKSKKAVKPKKPATQTRNATAKKK